MGIPSLQGGHLPPGRWVCDPTDVVDSFVKGLDPKRFDIWQDWLSASALLKELVGEVPAAWMSGSFFTSRIIPGDIDSIFIVESDVLKDAYMRLSPEDWATVVAFARGGIKEGLSLNVDSYILEWCPTPTARRDAGEGYYADRGYWDDLWVRVKDPTDPRLDSIPHRGYLEVMIDGYK